MEDMDNKLNALLNDPEAMGRIKQREDCRRIRESE